MKSFLLLLKYSLSFFLGGKNVWILAVSFPYRLKNFS
jgi:hypothetical protein